MESIFKKSIIIAASLVFGAVQVSIAQVKVGSTPTSIGPNSNLEVEAGMGSKFVVTKDSSKVGLGTVAPTNKLHVISPANPVRFEGVQTAGASGNEVPLVIDANGVVKKQSSAVPFPTLRLSAGVSASYNMGTNGATVLVPLDQSVSSDGNFSPTTHLYTVPTTGIYQISGALSFTGTTSTSTVNVQLSARVNGQGIKLVEFGGANFPIGNVSGTIAGTATIPLAAGSTIGLVTTVCFACGTQTYTGTTTYTNMTITKMN